VEDLIQKIKKIQDEEKQQSSRVDLYDVQPSPKSHFATEVTPRGVPVLVMGDSGYTGPPSPGSPGGVSVAII